MKIGDLVIKTPIIQGGMGVGISLSGLASAVAKAGGMGVIAANGIAMTEPDQSSNYVEASNRALRKQIQAVREETDGALGVNIMVALTNYAELVKVAIKEGVDAIISGAGLPMNLPEYVAEVSEASKTKLIPIVSSARAAVIICKRWLSRFGFAPDAFVVEGPRAGGHLGFKREQIDDPAHALEKLVPEVIEGVKAISDKTGKAIPVIAAGGVFTGADIYKFMKMGAAGVQMGTRFVATHECDASDAFKQEYINAKKEDIVVIQSPVGLPGRAIKNAFLESLKEGKHKPAACPFNCVHSCDYTKAPYCISMALINAKKGKLKHGFAFAGANAFLVDAIVSVKELMTALEREYDLAIAAALELLPSTS
jgi:nitronate monooxygenase